MTNIKTIGNGEEKLDCVFEDNDTPSDTIGDVKALMASGDETSAFEMCRRAAVKGEIKSMTMLGLMYLEGTGVEQDTFKAMVWFEKAHHAGNPAASRMLGALYLDKKYIEPDFELGKLYVEVSALRGDGLGQYLFSTILRHRGDKDRWLEFLQKSADSGCVEGMRELAKVHLNKSIPDADPSVGIELLRSAVNGGDGGAMARLAQELIDGTNVERSYTDAIDLCRKSAEKGDVDGMTLLGKMLVDGKGCHVSAEAGTRWLRRAADKGGRKARKILSSLPAEFMCQTGAESSTSAQETDVPIRESEGVRLS